MPTYPYACTACEHRFEIVQSFSDDALTVCPECAGRLRKVFGSVGVVFKGSGFYRNDSRDKKPVASGSGDSSGSSDSGGGETTKSGTEKPAAAKSSPGKESGSGSGSSSGSGSGTGSTSKPAKSGSSSAA